MMTASDGLLKEQRRPTAMQSTYIKQLTFRYSSLVRIILMYHFSIIEDHLSSAYAKSSGKLAFLTP